LFLRHCNGIKSHSFTTPHGNYSAQTMYLKHLLAALPIKKTVQNQIIKQEAATKTSPHHSTNALKSIRAITFEHTTLFDQLYKYFRDN
jgi:hypothetical protein